MASFGRIEEFSADKENIELPGACGNFFQANGRQNRRWKESASFPQHRWRKYIRPTSKSTVTGKASGKKFDELKVELKKHFEPKRSSSPSVLTSTEETKHQTRALPSTYPNFVNSQQTVILVITSKNP